MPIESLTPAQAKTINDKVRSLPFTPEEKAELATRAGLSKRHVDNFFAPLDAKVQRPLIPQHAVGVPFTRLTPSMLARVELALSLLPPKELLGNTTHTPHSRRGVVRTTEEVFSGLLPALDRVKAFQTNDSSVDVYLRHFWQKIDVLPVGDGTWEVKIEYRSEAGSPPMLNADEYELDNEEDEDEGGF